MDSGNGRSMLLKPRPFRKKGLTDSDQKEEHQEDNTKHLRETENKPEALHTIQ